MPSNRQLDVRIEKFHLVVKNLPIVISGSIVVALTYFFFLEGDLPIEVRARWILFFAAITVVRMFVLRHWYTHDTTRENVNQRIAIATIFIVILSSTIGYYGYIGIGESNLFSTLLILIIGVGLVGGATVSSAFFLPMFLLSVLPIMLPLTVKMFSFEHLNFQWLSVLSIVFLFACTGAAHLISDSVSKSINMRYENADLLENLKVEKIRAEEALKREAQANLAKSKFLAAASHDLRQPLHSLRLFTATLELQTRDSEHKTLVSQIDTSVKSLEELFNALLDISKLDAGTLTTNKQHIQVLDLLKQLEFDFQPLADEKEIDLICEFEECVVYTDIVLLERLLRNLISNAISYTALGSVTLTTKLEVDSLSISVVDTGPGIPAGDQSRVFEEFVQLENNSNRTRQGIGLGLSIVKRLSILLSIPIALDSQPAIGTTFTIKVPVGQSEKCVLEREDIYDSVDEVDTLFVLVIDDEPAACLAVEGLLETWGCVVMTANSGNAALIQLEEIGEVPDVILSDYQLLNNETGGAAIAKVRDLLSMEIPAIILTGDIAPERLLAIKKLGFPTLHKPCEPDALRRLLAEQIIAPDHAVA